MPARLPLSPPSRERMMNGFRFGLFIAAGGSMLLVLENAFGRDRAAEFELPTATLIMLYLIAAPISSALFGLALPQIVSSPARALAFGAASSLAFLIPVGFVLAIDSAFGWLGIGLASLLLGGSAGVFLRHVETHPHRQIPSR